MQHSVYSDFMYVDAHVKMQAKIEHNNWFGELTESLLIIMQLDFDLVSRALAGHLLPEPRLLSAGVL